eukprot:13773480-Alexandrium_andersonii.AAC.1
MSRPGVSWPLGPPLVDPPSVDGWRSRAARSETSRPPTAFQRDASGIIAVSLPPLKESAALMHGGRAANPPWS